MKIYSKIFFSTLCMLLLSISTYAADNDPKVTTKVISGMVVDADGMPLEGISVFAVKANNFAVTDPNGNYTIKVETGDYLTVQDKGYNKRVVSILDIADDGYVIDLQAWSDLRSGDKLKISYGEYDFDRMTGAASVVSGDELRLTGSYNIMEAMTGRVSGFSVSPSDTKPNTLSFSGSMRGSSDYYSLVDGARSSTDINTTEVDNVVILKDLASTSLFGADASNGALYINTKQGQVGESSINVSYSHGFQSATFLPDMMDGVEFAKMYDQALINDGLPAYYGEDAYEAIASGSDPIKYPNVDYYDEFVNDFTSYNKAIVEFSGGGNTAQYYSTLDLYQTTGLEVYDPTEMLRFRLRSNLKVAVTDFVHIDLGIGGGIYNDSGSTYYYNSQLFNTIRTIPNTALAFVVGQDEEDGELIYQTNRNYTTNLMVSAANNGVTKGVYRNAFTRFGFDIDLDQFVTGLSFDGFVNVDINNSALQVLAPTTNLAYVLWSLDETLEEEVMDLVISQTDSDDSTWAKSDDAITRAIDTRFAAHYDRTFGDDHMLTVDLGVNFYEETCDSYYWPVYDFNAGARANYFYKNKYVLDGTVTTSRTNTLAEENRSAMFYTVGAGWIASREDFLQDVSWLDYLKVRANYGTSSTVFRNANSSSGTYYLYQGGFGVGSSYGFGDWDSQSSKTNYYRSFIASPDVDWPRITSFSAGIDARLLDNRLNVQANYFAGNECDNIIREDNLSALVGNSTSYLSYINYGKTSYDGVELDLSWRGSKGKFSYVVGGNAMYRVTFNDQANAVDYPDSESDRNYTGQQGSLLRGLESIGVISTQEQLDAYNDTYTSYFGTVQLGDLGYVDQNGDYVIDEKDIVITGHSPRIYYGLYTTLKYSNFSLSIRGEGVADGQYYNTNLRSAGGSSNYYAAQADLYPFSNNLPRATMLGSTNNNQTSDFWMRSASYFNIKNVCLSYTLPTEIANRLFSKSIDLFVVGNNLLVLSPENDVYSPYRTSGISVYPVMRSIEVGVDLKF